MPGEDDGPGVCAPPQPLPSSAVAARRRSRAWQALPATGLTEAAARSSREPGSDEDILVATIVLRIALPALLMRRHAERLWFRPSPSSPAAPLRRRKRTLPHVTRDKGG
jgi:hypothetical protein